MAGDLVKLVVKGANRLDQPTAEKLMVSIEHLLSLELPVAFRRKLLGLVTTLGDLFGFLTPDVVRLVVSSLINCTQGETRLLKACRHALHSLVKASRMPSLYALLDFLWVSGEKLLGVCERVRATLSAAITAESDM